MAQEKPRINSKETSKIRQYVGVLMDHFRVVGPSLTSMIIDHVDTMPGLRNVPGVVGRGAQRLSRIIRG